MSLQLLCASRWAMLWEVEAGAQVGGRGHKGPGGDCVLRCTYEVTQCLRFPPSFAVPSPPFLYVHTTHLSSTAGASYGVAPPRSDPLRRDKHCNRQYQASMLLHRPSSACRLRADAVQLLHCEMRKCFVLQRSLEPDCVDPLRCAHTHHPLRMGRTCPCICVCVRYTDSDSELYVQRSPAAAVIERRRGLCSALHKLLPPHYRA